MLKEKVKFLKSSYVELGFMLLLVVFAYIGLTIIALLASAPNPGEMGHGTIVLWLLAFFLLSFSIAIVSVVAGIGGGVIFTPLMLAFTPVNSIIIRGTGLIVAMSSGPISTGIFMKRGIGHFRLCCVLVISQGIGAFFGAQVAIGAAHTFGDGGEGFLRVALGTLLVFVAIYFSSGGKKMEYPRALRVDALSKWMQLEHSYLEESEGKIHSYQVSRIFLGLALVFVVGFLGSFFGMGAGWALTPVQNLGLGMPLKAAMANSGISVAMVGSVSIWPYLLAGGIIPLFVLPWLAGQVVGGYLGAILLVKIKVAMIRVLLIGILFFTSFGLVSDGLLQLNIIGNVPGQVSVALFVFIMLACLFVVFKMHKKEEGGENGKNE